MSSEAPRIVHVSLRVRDLEASSRFYQQLFGFRRLGGDSRSKDHVSRHLTDGVIDLALIEYPEDRGRADCPTPGATPGIHHFGVAVADLEAWTRRVREAGGQLLTPPGEVPVKFRDPDGAICELVPFGRYQVA
ncbi:MAG TPA: VOC family protein [Candidatus Methylomirabilis sp.]|nr:VOC family protein [Candidatus Methylomirabilis sp.]